MQVTRCVITQKYTVLIAIDKNYPPSYQFGDGGIFRRQD